MYKIGQLVTLGPEKYAIEKGHFRNVSSFQWVGFRCGSEVMEAFHRGELDGGVIGSLPAVIKAYNQKKEFRVVAVGNIESPNKPTSYLVAKKDSGLVDIKDLSGKRLGLHGRGTLLELALKTVFLRSGIAFSEDQIRILYMKEMGWAIEFGEVDAAFVFYPQYEEIRGVVNIIATSSEVFPNIPGDVLFFRKNVLDRDPEFAGDFVRAYLRGVRDASANPYHELNPSGKVSPDSFEPILNAMRNQGINVDIQGMLDFSFIEE
jgi:ABC-type nitrate/sulfonate/bicarbonate transport system substrate-binding protein